MESSSTKWAGRGGCRGLGICLVVLKDCACRTSCWAYAQVVGMEPALTCLLPVSTLDTFMQYAFTKRFRIIFDFRTLLLASLKILYKHARVTAVLTKAVATHRNYHKLQYKTRDCN